MTRFRLAGNELIATDYSAHTEFASKAVYDLIDYKLIPVSNMNWSPWYKDTQKWADINQDEFKLRMKLHYEMFIKGKKNFLKQEYIKDVIKPTYNREALCKKLLEVL